MLTLTDLKLVLSDMLEKRHADLVRSRAGRFYEHDLIEARTAIDALPPALTGGIPLAHELDGFDARHDGYGAAIYFTTEVYLRLPDAPAELRDAAREIRAAFIPSLSELHATYALEAEHALARKPKLESLKAKLKLFPFAEHHTLFDVAKHFLDAGEQLHQTLSQRADVTPGSRREATTLRPATIGTLNRFRADLRKEIDKTPELPRDLEARVFGYLDTLAGMHATPSGEAPVSPPAPGGTPSTH